MEQLIVPTEFDSSMLDCWMVCPRKFYFRHILNLVSQKRATPLEFGTAIHAGLDEWFRSNDVKAACEVFKAEWEKFGWDCEDDAQRTAETGVKCIKGYAKKYAQEPFEVIDIEIPFEILINELTFIGRMDKIIKWSGETGPMDHKTTSRLGYTTFQQFNPNMQFDGYMYATQKLYDPSCLWALPDMLCTNKTHCGKASGYQRNKEFRVQEQVDEFPRLFCDIADEIQRNCKENKFIPRYSSCTYYGTCPYRDVCMAAPSNRDKIVDSNYDVKAWDPREGMDKSKIKRVEVK